MNVDFFARIQGNDLLKERLKTLAASERIPSALLFSGPEAIGKSEFARAFAASLIGDERPLHCRHPDVFETLPEGKIGMHTIEALRTFCEDVYRAPLESDWKIFIIHDADRMLQTGASALLKTLEEPSSNTVIILLSSNPMQLLPTILSRCWHLRFAPIGTPAYPLREILLPFLSSGKFSSYADFMETSKALIAQIDTEQSLSDTEHLTAYLRDKAKKKDDGLHSVKIRTGFFALLAMIGEWFADLELIRLAADKSCLRHPDSIDALLGRVQKGGLPSLEKVLQILDGAKTMLQRNTSLAICIENLLLRIHELASTTSS